MSKMKNRNSTVKILALFISILLWSYVRGEDNPQIIREFKGVNVAIINEKLLNDSGLVVVEPKEIKISVKISGKRNDVNSIDIGDIKAQVDLANATKGTKNIRIDIDHPLNVSLYDVSDRYASFEIDSMITVKKDIELNVIESSGTDSIKDYTISPKTIEVSGPSTFIDKISKVIVDINIDKLDSNGIMKLPVKIIDSKGKEIKEVTSNIDMIEVSFSLLKSKKVNIKTKISGSLDEGYKISSITVNPKTVIIKGLDEDINGIEDIETEDINIADIDESGKISVKLKLPEGITVDDGKQNVIVDIKLEKIIVKEIKVGIEQIDFENIKEGLTAKIDDSSSLENIDIRIKGNRYIIDNFNIKDLKLTANLNSLEEGIHNVELAVSPLQDIEIESLNPKNIKINIENIETEEAL